MKSSVRSTSSLRQSESLAGRLELSSAVLRRCNSLCARAATRVRAALATFSKIIRAAAFSLRLLLLKKCFNCAETTWETMRVTALVPSTSLVWPSNCGSARRTVITPVKPSRTSSLMTSGSLVLSNFADRSASLNDFVTDLSKPVTCVPPLGVAMIFTNDLTTVSYSLPQRSAMSTTTSRSTSVVTM
ncbi:unannotated protein [freshwater metagenome]|uniref:Unannotated protein n=1 Tax=freshwater metagenome TaxID=449393 RepID=A0A6J7VJ30_9ZZZZ